MAGGGIVERLEAVRSDVELACGWLVRPSPEVLDRCSAVLATAASSLADSSSFLGQEHGQAEALAEAWRLHAAVRRAGKLLQHASDYHVQWTRILGGMAEGYRPGGDPAALVAPGRISLHG